MASVHNIQQTIPIDSEIEHKYQSFYGRTTLLGFLVGVVIQISTMGALYLLVSYNTTPSVDRSIKANSEQCIIIFCVCCWSTLTSVFAFMVLDCIHHYLGIEHRRLRHHEIDDHISKRCENESRDSAAMDMSEAYSSSLVQVDHRFFAGVTVGGCLSWALTDLILGVQKNAICYTLALPIALLWYYIFFKWTFTEKRWDQLKNKTNSENMYVALV
jgi:hypothetical protein